MIKKILISTALLLCCTAIGFAADINGEWIGNMKGTNGPTDFLFTFIVNGNTLKGMIGSQGVNQPIVNGKINGDNFSFETNSNGNPVSYTGKVLENSLQLTIKQSQTEMTLTRKATTAVNIGGNWQGEFSSPDLGNLHFKFNFQINKDNLTGTVKSEFGETTIRNGKVKGADFSFYINVDDNKIDHKGQYSNGIITIEISGYQDNFKIPLMRALEG